MNFRTFENLLAGVPVEVPLTPFDTFKLLEVPTDATITLVIDGRYRYQPTLGEPVVLKARATEVQITSSVAGRVVLAYADGDRFNLNPSEGGGSSGTVRQVEGINPASENGVGGFFATVEDMGNPVFTAMLWPAEDSGQGNGLIPPQTWDGRHMLTGHRDTGYGFLQTAGAEFDVQGMGTCVLVVYNADGADTLRAHIGNSGFTGARVPIYDVDGQRLSEIPAAAAGQSIYYIPMVGVMNLIFLAAGPGGGTGWGFSVVFSPVVWVPPVQ